MSRAPGGIPFLLCGLLLAFGGCLSKPPPDDANRMENPAVPDKWTAAPDSDATTPEAWLEDFNSTELRTLVREALEQNSDVRAAAARLAEAAAEGRVRGANELPTADLGFDSARQKINTFGPFNAGGTRFRDFDLDLNLSWEADIWGRMRDRTSAAEAGIQASRAELESARLSLAGQIAKAWFQMIEAVRQLELAENLARSQQRQLKSMEERYHRGLTQISELRALRRASRTAEARENRRRRTLDESTRNLELLLGRYPAAEIGAANALPPLPPPPPTGLPSDLLSRRPDIVAAEREVLAAGYERDAARKELLPSIALTAEGGTSTRSLSNLLDTNRIVWRLAGNLTQPIFQGGRIMAQIDQADASRERAIANYMGTAKQAFFEVETALAGEEFLRQREEQFTQALQEAEASSKRAWAEYRNGNGNLPDAMEADRTAWEARSRLLQSRRILLENRVDLYLALGGPFATES